MIEAIADFCDVAGVVVVGLVRKGRRSRQRGGGHGGRLDSYAE